MTTTPVNVVDTDLPFVDVMGTAFARDPHGVIKDARRAGVPFVETQRGVEASTYSMVWKLLAHPGFGTEHAHQVDEADITERIASWNKDGLLLFMPAETHARVRKAVVRPFSVRRIERLRPQMKAVAERLADEFPSDGGDLVASYTHRYSIENLCLLLGVPLEDIPRFEDATVALRLGASVPLAPVVGEFDAGLERLWDYTLALIEERRRRPTDDFISDLVAAQRDDPAITQTQLVWSIANLLFAGHDTTRYQLASVVRAVIESGAWERLRERPDLVPAAVDEACRIYPVVQYLKRQAVEDVDLDGWLVPAGTQVNLNMLAASRDPEAFPEPDTFDLEREGDGYRAVYGWGVHRCVGHALARAELIEALAVLVARFESAEIVGDINVHPTTSMMGGPEALHVHLS